MIGPGRALPLISLDLPIVAMAAAYGRREAIVVGVTALALVLAPVALGFDRAGRQIRRPG